MFRGEILIKKVICILFSLIFLLLFASCNDESDKISAVATVNGEEITEEEFEYFRKKYKSEVLNDCLEKFNTEYTENFWQTELDGVTPEELLYERALEECVRAKVQFLLMKDEGIYEDVTFAGLKAKAEAFNKENENKEGVVGIKSIQMSRFYSYYLQTGIMELQNIYAEGKLKPSEKEIEEKISEIRGTVDASLEQDFESIAKSKLKTEKYEKYVNELCEKAEIKEIQKYGKQG